MKTFTVRLLFAVLSMVAFAAAQDVVPLYPGTPPGSTQENYPEKQYFSKVWNEDVVANVTRPTLTIFKPSPELKNGTNVTQRILRLCFWSYVLIQRNALRAIPRETRLDLLA